MSTLQTEGVYEIHTYKTPANMICISGSSTSANANAIIWSWNDLNAEKFNIIKDTVTSGCFKIKNLNSGYVLDVEHGKMANGTNSMQYKDWGDDDTINSRAQRWNIVSVGKTYSGKETNYQALPLYKFECEKDHLYVFDTLHGETARNSNLQINEDWGDDDSYNNPAQHFFLKKDSKRNANLATPYDIGFSTDATGNAQRTVAINSETTIYPCWQSSESYFQYRVRYKNRKAGKNTYATFSTGSEYSYWQGGSQFTYADDGWGDAWNYGIASSGTDTTTNYGAEMTVSQDVDNIDARVYQLEVRSCDFDDDGLLEHGHSYVEAVKVCWSPTVSIAYATLAPSGLTVAYVSDFPRDDNSISNLSIVVDGQTLVSYISKSHAAQTGIITIPFSELAFIPANDATCEIAFNFTTIDYTFARSVSSSISYATSHAIADDPMFTSADGMIEYASFGTYDAAMVTITYNMAGTDKTVNCDIVSNSAIMYPPFNKEYTINALVAQDDNTWATWTGTRTGQSTNKMIWNWGSEYTVLFVGNEENPSISDSITRDYTSALTTGATYETVAFGVGSTRTQTVTGTVIPAMNIDHCTYTDVEKLQTAGEATFRTKDGNVYSVAITGVSKTIQDNNFMDVTVDMIITQ